MRDCRTHGGDHHEPSPGLRDATGGPGLARRAAARGRGRRRGARARGRRAAPLGRRPRGPADRRRRRAVLPDVGEGRPRARLDAQQPDPRGPVRPGAARLPRGGGGRPRDRARPAARAGDVRRRGGGQRLLPADLPARGGGGLRRAALARGLAGSQRRVRRHLRRGSVPLPARRVPPVPVRLLRGADRLVPRPGPAPGPPTRGPARLRRESPPALRLAPHAPHARPVRGGRHERPVLHRLRPPAARRGDRARHRRGSPEGARGRNRCLRGGRRLCLRADRGVAQHRLPPRARRQPCDARSLGPGERALQPEPGGARAAGAGSPRRAPRHGPGRPRERQRDRARVVAAGGRGGDRVRVAAGRRAARGARRPRKAAAGPPAPRARGSGARRVPDRHDRRRVGDRRLGAHGPDPDVGSHVRVPRLLRAGCGGAPPGRRLAPPGQPQERAARRRRGGAYGARRRGLPGPDEPAVHAGPRRGAARQPRAGRVRPRDRAARGTGRRSSRCPGCASPTARPSLASRTTTRRAGTSTLRA